MHVLEVVPGYTMDIAVIPGASDAGVVIHTSGVHGVEGYAGSAIQIAALQKIAARNKPEAGEPTLVFVHAVNPYGMAHYRRWNENNVDLNRNAMLDSTRAEVLARDPNIAGYGDLDALINPKRPPTAVFAYVSVWASIVWNVAIHGITTLKRALVAAQYHDPRGIFFGGRELQRSHVLLWEFLQRFENSSTISWIDVHTGLGKSGIDTLLVQRQEEADQLQEAFPNNTFEVLGGDGDVVAGYELTKGILHELYRHRFLDDADSLFLAQEFGTVAVSLVVRALVLENMAHHHIDDKAARSPWTQFTRDAFYPSGDAEWRQSIVQRGLNALAAVIECRHQRPTPPG